jgi:Pectate lyase superfamily protein
MTTPLTNYAFSISTPFGASPGTAVLRTMPNRYNDIISVKDWGAQGDGINDDRPGIEAAVAYAATLNSSNFNRTGALIFLPPGIYNIATPPLTLDNFGNGSSFGIMGSGRDATIIKGNTNGWLVHTTGNGNIGDISDLTFWNQNTGTSAAAFVSDGFGNTLPFLMRIHFIGYYGYVCTHGEYNIRIQDCVFDPPIGPYGSGTIGAANSTTPGPMAGSVGAYIAQAAFINNTINNFDIGLGVRGQSKLIAANRVNRCNNGVYLGNSPDPVKFPPDDPQAAVTNATQLYGNVFDRCGVSINAHNFTMGLAIGNVIQGAEGVAESAPIQNMVWDGVNTVTVTTATPHNIATGTNALQLFNILPVGFMPNPFTDMHGNTVANLNCTTTSSTTFTYPLGSSPGGGFVSGKWNRPLYWGILCNSAQYATFACNYLDNLIPFFAGIDFDNFGTNALDQSLMVSMQPACGWITPGDNNNGGSLNASKCMFINCGRTGTVRNGVGVSARIAVTPFIKFTGLPTPILETEFNVVDATTQAAFAGVVTGGGLNHYKIHGSGGGWVRAG